jgi:hypothetical protein
MIKLRIDLLVEMRKNGVNEQKMLDLKLEKLQQYEH